jgi:CRISPR-associated protein Csm4
MLSTRVALLTFEKGYHVGWRRPREIVDHSTVLRALIYLAHITGSERCARLLESGGLEVSALLPALPVGGGYVRLLTVFPYLPCLGKASRFRGLYTTLPALEALMRFAGECHEAKGVPAAREVDEVTGVKLYCAGGVREVRAPPLGLRGRVVCLEGSECGEFQDHAVPRFVELVSEHRNRIDRVSGAADVFVLYGVRPATPMWLALRGSDEALSCASGLLELLQHTGIGGLRSRGWGRFRLEEPKLRGSDLEILNLRAGWATGLVYLLGTMPPGSWLRGEFSYAGRHLIMGMSGPSNSEYRLPVLEVMDVGSLVYVESPPNPVTIPIDGGRAVYVFNPVVLHAG